MRLSIAMSGAARDAGDARQVAAPLEAESESVRCGKRSHYHKVVERDSSVALVTTCRNDIINQSDMEGLCLSIFSVRASTESREYRV